MSEDLHNRDEPAVASVRRGIRWDALAAIIASLIGLLALLVSGYTAYIERQQTRAQVWPYLEIIPSDLLPSNYAGDSQSGLVLGKGGRFVVINKGVGPAIVDRVEVDVDGKPQLDWRQVLKALHVTVPSSASLGTSKFDGMVLSPGETLSPFVMADAKTWRGIKDRIFSQDKFVIRACYHSTLNEHWLATSSFHPVHLKVKPVRDCRMISRKNKFKQ